MSHDAARQYLDLTPLVVLVLVGFMATRYIARGFNAEELFVLSGVITAVLMGLRFALMLMGRRSA